MSTINLTRRNFLGALGISAASLLAACGNAGTEPEAAPEEAVETEAPEAEAVTPDVIRVATLKGPTSIGLAELIQAANGGTAALPYECTMYTSPADEVLPLLVKGEVDIACLPANVAAVAYAKTEGAVQVIDINTLGVLYMVSADPDLTDLAGVAGRTLYITNKGASPDYVAQYVLAQNDLLDQVTIEYKDEPTEVVSALASDPTAVGVLPEPFVTASTTKNEALHVISDLTEEWLNIADTGSQNVTGVTVARTEFIGQYPEVIDQFLADHADSVAAVNGDPETYGQVVADLGIVDAAPIAAKAIPNCNLVCITGDEMKDALVGYYQVLFDADPTSVAGALPDDAFYYLG